MTFGQMFQGKGVLDLASDLGSQLSQVYKQDLKY